MKQISSLKGFLQSNDFAHSSWNSAYFIINILYLNFFFYVLLAISGSFFQVNSNFLLFFTFTSFL